MKKIIVLSMLCLILPGCSPWSEKPLSKKTVELLETPQAIELWKKVTTETDNCSSPSIIRSLVVKFSGWKNWDDCCTQHDFDYREGAKFGITKEQADYALWQCIDASGHRFVANVCYDSVMLFGQSSYIGGE